MQIYKLNFDLEIQLQVSDFVKKRKREGREKMSSLIRNMPPQVDLLSSYLSLLNHK